MIKIIKGNFAGGNFPSMMMNQGQIGASAGTTGIASRFMEQMNQATQPNEEIKQNAVEQLLSLQKAQSVSSPSAADTKSKEDNRGKTKEPKAGVTDEAESEKPKKDGLEKIEVTSI